MLKLSIPLGALVGSGAVLVATACSAPRTATSSPAAAHAVVAHAPSVGADRPVNLDGLHNVVTYDDQLVCGGVPEGERGLATLKAMGIKTILSVDGGAPDVAAAERLGMRYVHLPISYDTVTPERQVQLAQVLANAEGPIYTHCHHGKHRSAAALASAMVLAGKLTPEAAQGRMKVSGTAKEYTGLWEAVRAAKPLPTDALRADPASFPSVTKVSGMVAIMAEIDMVNDLVKQAKDAAWRAPTDHPDLVPPKETARLASLFASLRGDGESAALPAEYQKLLAKSIEQSQQLDDALRTGDTKRATELVTTLNKSCKECHVAYRDK